MKILGFTIAFGLLLLSAFALANWTVLTAPTSLSLIAFSVEGPLGIILLGITLLFISLSAAYAMVQRTSMLVQSRSHAKELQVQRDLADKAESSRFDALRELIGDEFSDTQASLGEAIRGFLSRVEDMEQALLKSSEESTCAMSAHLGEVEDKLDLALKSKAE